MSAYIQIIAGHGIDSFPCVIFVNDAERILFDASEGIQRLFFEQKLKPIKLEHVFLTSMSVEVISGLPGFILTMAGSGKKSINITGPFGLSLMLEATQYYSYLEDFRIGVNEIGCSLQIVETKSRVKVTTLPLSSSENKPAGCCYLITTPLVPGKLNMKRVKELGIPVGPMLAKLKNGNSISLEDGRIIDPTCDGSILGETVPSKRVFIVCDLFGLASSTDNSLLSNFLEQLFALIESCPEILSADCIVHNSPLHIVSCESYMSFLSLFPSTSCHIFCGSGCNKITTTPFQSAYIHAMKLNMIDGDIFPDLSRSLLSNDSVELNWTNFEASFRQFNSNIFQSEPCLRFNLLPLQSFGINSSYTSESFKSLVIDNQLRQAACDYSIKKQEAAQDDCFQYDDVSLMFLGTGCSSPSIYRNVSGICLSLPSRARNGVFHRLLMDCGEGSYGQLLRVLSSQHCNDIEAISSIIKSVSVIWLSHPHADHHLGLARFLIERKQLYINADADDDDCRMICIGPRSLLNWILALERMDSRLVGSYTWIDIDCSAVQVNDISSINGDLYHKRFLTSNDVQYLDNDLAAVCNKLELISIQSVPVIHCPDAFSLVLTSDTYKIVYSGDCRPSSDLINHGYGATLLIHEATFGSDKPDLAVAKRHSTVIEAIEVSVAMKAQSTILTHFSQRYPNIPDIPDEYKSCVSVAFDYMNISLTQLSSYYRLLFDPLSSLYEKEDEEKCNDNDG